LFKLSLAKPDTSTLKLLCLGAHSDDIEIGCGGTILRLLMDYKNIDVCWVVFSSGGQRAAEATESARLFLEND
jgi:LmbE family N-acetylglucosaminyl deacetylase